MNGIADIRRVYCDNEITNIGWIRSQQNVADKFSVGMAMTVLTMLCELSARTLLSRNGSSKKIEK